MSERVLGIVWRAATVASAAWLVVALAVAAARPRQDRRAHERLQHLRHLATQPDRALVYIQTTIGNAAAGQHAVVLNVAAGTLHRVWLSEATVPLGAFVVLQRVDEGAKVVDWMSAHAVEDGHRYERRRGAPTLPGSQALEDLPEVRGRDDVRQLIEEVEVFLMEQGPQS